MLYCRKSRWAYPDSKTVVCVVKFLLVDYIHRFGLDRSGLVYVMKYYVLYCIKSVKNEQYLIKLFLVKITLSELWVLYEHRIWASNSNFDRDIWCKQISPSLFANPSQVEDGQIVHGMPPKPTSLHRSCHACMTYSSLQNLASHHGPLYLLPHHAACALYLEWRRSFQPRSNLRPTQL